jgi:hypothetical protein
MTTEDEREKAAAEVRHRSQGLDEVETGPSAIEKAAAAPHSQAGRAVGRPARGSLARNREAIREFGCRIVAQALEKK